MPDTNCRPEGRGAGPSGATLPDHVSPRFLPSLVLAALCVSRAANADVPVRALVEAMDQAERASGAPGTGSVRSALTTLPAIIRSAPGSIIPADAGVLPVAPGFAVVQGSPDHLRRLAADHPDWSLLW